MSMSYGGDTINDTDGGVLRPISSVMRNRIINGAMVIDQRNAGASVTPSGAQYNIDRWWTFGTQSSKFTIQQNAGSVTPPIGFTNYLGITSSSAYSVTSTDQFILAQWIEGFNALDLGWGTANAKTVTLSFQVYSSLTGSFGGCIQNYSNNRSYPFSYSIPIANTWTAINITIAGDTTGTWGTTSTGFGGVIFSLGAGSNFNNTANTWATGNFKQPTGATSVVGTSGATFYITGVQLEKGTQATGFEYENYTSLLQKCQRYYEKAYYAMTAAVAVATIHVTTAYYRVTKRATPTIVYTTGEGTAATFQNYTESLAISGVPGANQRIDGSFTSSAEL